MYIRNSKFLHRCLIFLNVHVTNGYMDQKYLKISAHYLRTSIIFIKKYWFSLTKPAKNTYSRQKCHFSRIIHEEFHLTSTTGCHQK